MKLGMSLKSGGKQAWNDNFELVGDSAVLILVGDHFTSECLQRITELLAFVTNPRRISEFLNGAVVIC